MSIALSLLLASTPSLACSWEAFGISEAFPQAGTTLPENVIARLGGGELPDEVTAERVAQDGTVETIELSPRCWRERFTDADCAYEIPAGFVVAGDWLTLSALASEFSATWEVGPPAELTTPPVPQVWLGSASNEVGDAAACTHSEYTDAEIDLVPAAELADYERIELGYTTDGSTFHGLAIGAIPMEGATLGVSAPAHDACFAARGVAGDGTESVWSDPLCGEAAEILQPKDQVGSVDQLGCSVAGTAPTGWLAILGLAGFLRRQRR